MRCNVPPRAPLRPAWRARSTVMCLVKESRRIVCRSLQPTASRLVHLRTPNEQAPLCACCPRLPSLARHGCPPSVMSATGAAELPVALESFSGPAARSSCPHLPHHTGPGHAFGQHANPRPPPQRQFLCWVSLGFRPACRRSGASGGRRSNAVRWQRLWRRRRPLRAHTRPAAPPSPRSRERSGRSWKPG